MAASALVFELGFPDRQAVAQTAKDLVGSWSLVSATANQDSKKVEVLGPNPKGLMILDANGHYAVLQFRSDPPKSASNVRPLGILEESKAAGQGGISHFGRYSVDETDKTLVFHIEASSSPAWNGTEQKQNFMLSGDELTFTSLGSTSLGSSQATYKRAK